MITALEICDVISGLGKIWNDSLGFWKNYGMILISF